MRKHAILSASSAHRWMRCPPSARLCEKYEDKGSDYTLQGTCAHELCQYKIEKLLGRDPNDPTENIDFYDEEMEVCADSYAAFVMELVEAAKEHCDDPLVLIEQRLDFSEYVPEGFGTGDCVIVSDGTLHVIDYKHGVGVLVEAEGNEQMRCYAVGALSLFDSLYDIETISMTIFQPRRDNISTETLSRDDLLRWAEDVLRPTARLAYAGEGEFCAGEHCQFCKAKATCRKRAEYNLELARYDFEMPAELAKEEIEAILPRVDELISWAGDVKEHALSQALSGVKYEGYKLVEGRSVRKYRDEISVARAVEKAGHDPFERKLRGITAMTAMLGRKQFDEILGDLVYKPPGKPALVQDSDKRPAMNTAKDIFETEEN